MIYNFCKSNQKISIILNYGHIISIFLQEISNSVAQHVFDSLQIPFVGSDEEDGPGVPFLDQIDKRTIGVEGGFLIIHRA